MERQNLLLITELLTVNGKFMSLFLPKIFLTVCDAIWPPN